MARGGPRQRRIGRGGVAGVAAVERGQLDGGRLGGMQDQDQADLVGADQSAQTPPPDWREAVHS